MYRTTTPTYPFIYILQQAKTIIRMAIMVAGIAYLKD